MGMEVRRVRLPVLGWGHRLEESNYQFWVGHVESEIGTLI